MRENVRKNGTSSPCGETWIDVVGVVGIAVLMLSGLALLRAQPAQPTWRQLVREHLAACHDGRADVGRCERSEAALRLRVEEEGR